MLIKSREHLMAHTASLLTRAQRNLQNDGNLFAVLLFETAQGTIRMDICLGELSNSFIENYARGVLKEHPDVELVTFICLADGVPVGEYKRMPKHPSEHPARVMAIGAEVSHPDFGYLRMHTEYRLDGSGFVFEPIARSSEDVTPPSDSFLKNLWPKRKLNS